MGETTGKPLEDESLKVKLALLSTTSQERASEIAPPAFINREH
jgi:hypothetical protein